ncbi:MAG: S-layer homology domain-containing protein [Eggerthellaceae bacterium]|nr:S-layer homology domain-containing protein [Eggerthellaceae bacterium]
MTACKQKTTTPACSKAVGATLAGVLALGMVPATALTAFADEPTTDGSDISLLTASEGTAFQNGTVSSATNSSNVAIDNLSNITFPVSNSYQYAIPTSVTPLSGSAPIQFSWDFTDINESTTEINTVEDSPYVLKYYAAATDGDSQTIDAGGTTINVSQNPVSPSSINTVGTYYAVITYTVPSSTTNTAGGDSGLEPKAAESDSETYSNYLKFSIVNRSLEGVQLYNEKTESYTFTYNGSPQTVSLMLNGNPLTESDATISIVPEGETAPETPVTTVTNAGTYVANITGTGYYADSTAKITFTVAPLDLSTASITLNLDEDPLASQTFGTEPSESGYNWWTTLSVNSISPLTETSDTPTWQTNATLKWVSGPSGYYNGANGVYKYTLSANSGQTMVIGSQTFTATKLGFNPVWFYGTQTLDSETYTSETPFITILTEKEPNYFDANAITFAYDLKENGSANTLSDYIYSFNDLQNMTLTVADSAGNNVTSDTWTSTPGTYTVVASIDESTLNYITGGSSDPITVEVTNGYITDSNVYVSANDVFPVNNTLTFTYSGSDVIPSITTAVYGSSNVNGTSPTLLTAGKDYKVTYETSDGEPVDTITSKGTYFENITSDTYLLIDSDGKTADSLRVQIDVNAANIYGIQATGLETYGKYTWGDNTNISTAYTGEAITPQIQFAKSASIAAAPVTDSATPVKTDALQTLDTTSSDTTPSYLTPESWTTIAPNDYTLTYYYSDDTSVTEASDVTFGTTAVDEIKDAGWYKVVVTPSDNFSLSTISGSEIPSQYSGTLYMYVYTPETPETPAEHKFSDVPEDAWYADSVYAAYDNGYMNGYGNTNFFGPNDYLTRGQSAIIAYNMAGGTYYADGAYNEEDNITTKYVDCPMGAYYNYAVNWATGEGIITGYETDGALNFGPDNNVTREQFATIMARYAEAEDNYTAPSEEEVDEILADYMDADQVSEWAREYVAWAVQQKIMGVNTDTLNPSGYTTRAEAAAMEIRLQPEALS